MNQNLFIIGHARSGTTILTEIVNTSPDICVLGEANLHFRWEMDDFVYTFNRQHHIANRLASRFTYLPSSWIGCSSRKVMEKLRETYPVVGSKVAFAPLREAKASWTQDIVFNFHYSNFQGARYLFSIRDPITYCISARKIFPQVPANDILMNWIQSLAFLVQAVRVFPHHWILPMEWLEPAMFAKLEAALNTRFEATPSWLVPSPPRAAADPAAIARFAETIAMSPETRSTALELLGGLGVLYDKIIGWIDRERLQFRLPFPAVDLYDEFVLPSLRVAGLALAPNLDQDEFANYFTAAADPTDGSWVKGGLSIECSTLPSATQAAVFGLREKEGVQHKSLAQRVYFNRTDAMEFSVELKPHGRHCCALQIGHPDGPTIAVFDLKRGVPTRMHQGPGNLMLDARCSELEGGWIRCSLPFVPTQHGMLDFSLYLLDDLGRFDYPGSATDGLLLRNLRLDQLVWPLLDFKKQLEANEPVSS